MRYTGRMHEPPKEKLQKPSRKVVEPKAVAALQDEAETAIRESEQKLRFLVDNTKEIILILDKRGRIIFANKKNAG